ncbi:monovalent cation/H+ antiporter complex subunit F [Modestobacter sp. Leaf380]|uniref:monovalent cation/H+ antiporter complex subunit F n=1 Tax=Modestobacter sp. Leaf380 TaxID=1736356 RepID=UPI0006FFF67F|nr:monovalent cation/H+ antiporter complex subunit F [Modestobacter sp. Leaf380]KQS68727.1 pH regulation protein F [Modestobacter sp. Leaf380]
MTVVAIACFALLGGGAVLILARLALGPSLLDRVVSTDALLVTIACGIAVYCAVYRDISLEPVLLVVALLAFVGSVSVARYIGGMLVSAETPTDATPSDADLAGHPEPAP